MPGITVKELKESLEHLPDDMLVVVQSDPEGNAYRYCHGADENAMIIGQHGEHLDVWDATWSADDADLTEEEWEQIKDETPKVLVLFP